MNAINASLQASFLAKLEGEHKFSLSIDNNSTTYTKTPANKATVNNFSIYINDAIHSNKWSEVSFKNAINAALETLKEFEFIDFNKKSKLSVKYLENHHKKN
ncbi:MAG: hypothetical protein HWD59_06310 [Coxiellaceae bacterium]|nr:MAG: hypothetical protein HWD59_06310 [Coxiellaceae bacterium]